MLDTSLLARSPARLMLFLKALSKKQITVPGYTRADGTYVPPHTKLVNYNPNVGEVLSGKSSHSHKEALKKLSKVKGFKDLPAEHQHAHVLSSAQNIQTAASKAAQVSVFKKDLLAGKKPSAANVAAFKELLKTDEKKAVAIRDSIIAAIGMDKFLDLVGPASMAQEDAKTPLGGPTTEQLAIAHEKLMEIASGAPGKKVGQAAYKQLEKDPAWVKKNAVDRLQDVVDKWKDLQDAATHAAKISTLTGKLAAGKVPSPGEMEAFNALDGVAKIKAIQLAVKKSGHNLSADQLEDLLGQGAEKAGIEVKAPAKSPPHFGQKHEGQTLGTSEGGSIFKFEGGKWSFLSDGSWSKITNHHWEQKLGEGLHPTNDQPLKVVPDPTGKTSFGEANAGKVFVGAAGPYKFKFDAGKWNYGFKDSPGTATENGWEEVTNPAFLEKLDAGKSPNGGALEQVADEAPQPDDGQWNYSPEDHGFSGASSLTFEDHETGESYYIVANDPVDGPGYQVGKLSPDGDEPDFKDYVSAERVQSHLQALGVHPPELNTIKKLANEDEPQEGDTKQGVGGLLTLKDGHWTLDNAAMVSFFNKHAIQPASPVATAVVQVVKEIASKGVNMPWQEMAKVKDTAKAYGYVPAMVNDLIDDLNGVLAMVVEQDIADNAEPYEAPAETKYVYDHLLHFTDGKSNKFWQVTVDPMKATATTTWGPIGAKNPQSKMYKHASAAAAYQAAKDAAFAKQKKGYKTYSVQDGALTVESAKDSYTASVAKAHGFGKANEGKVFTSKSAPELIIFKYEDGWHYSTNQGEHWVPIAPESPLGIALNVGQDANGDELVASKPDDGPHEGDVKPGKDGWLILKDGHWVKAYTADVMAKLCPVPEEISSSYLKTSLKGVVASGLAVSKQFKKISTIKMGMPNVNLTINGGKFVGRAKKSETGIWEPVSSSVAGKNIALALNWLEHAEKAQKEVLAGKMPPPSPFAGQVSAAPAPKPTATVAPTVPGVQSIDKWSKTGGQGGYNEGGTYRDPDGDEWYCKFPAAGAKVARNELLANKLYEAAGVAVPEVKLVSQGGKIGVASRIVKGAVNDKAMLQASKGAGLLEGFVADAWLANWDVVGNNPASGKGWDNIMFQNGKAVRIDNGGALLYGGAGGKKSDFGATVIELETMRDAAVNARTAKVFGKISQADLQASAEKVLSIPDSAIENMVKDFGPGDESEKAALAKTLLARKADLEAKFPKVAAKVKKAAAGQDDGGEAAPAVKGKKKKLDPRHLPVKAADLPTPHDFMNWQGQGKAISDKPYVAQNIADEKAILDFAMKGDLVALKQYKFQPVDKETGAPIGQPKTMAEHPSSHVKFYYDSVVTFLDVIANPPEPLKAFKGSAADTIGALAKAFKPFNYGHSVASVPPNQRLGFWIALGTVANPAHFQPVNVFKSITAVAKAQAYDKWNKLPSMVRKFLSAVQGSGSANQPYRDGKLTDNQGQNCRDVLSNLYAHASDHDEGFTIYKWMNMPESMIQQFLQQPEGLVFQNPGSMCCSRSAEGTKGFGSHRVIIHYAKGAKAMDTFGSGKFSGEQEVTTLPGSRFMVLSRKMVDAKGYSSSGKRLELEVLMLPPDQTYVDNLKETA